MTAPALSPRRRVDHIHLPSVHVVNEESGNGFDYTEDLYITGTPRRQHVERVVRLVVLKGGAVFLDRKTTDVLCPEELADFQEILPQLMDEGDPDVERAMQERANFEYARQARIAAGDEKACAGCGCSETRACSGGCIWATRALCSRCV